MERLIEFSSISAVTLFSILLALLIEVGLLKAVFHFMAHVKGAQPVAVTPVKWTSRRVSGLRNAAL